MWKETRNAETWVHSTIKWCPRRNMQQTLKHVDWNVSCIFHVDSNVVAIMNRFKTVHDGNWTITSIAKKSAKTALGVWNLFTRYNLAIYNPTKCINAGADIFIMREHTIFYCAWNFTNQAKFWESKCLLWLQKTYMWLKRNGKNRKIQYAISVWKITWKVDL